MNSLRTILVSLCFALSSVGCGDNVKVYQAKPPTPVASASAPAPAAPPDPEPWRAKQPGPGSPGELKFPTPEIITLKNGLTLYVVPRSTPLVSLSFVVRHGGSSVPPNKSGLAALTARMLTEATQKHDKFALAEAVEALGTSIGSDASRDESSIDLSVLGKDLDRGLELLAEVVEKPAFSGKDFERVRGEWLDGLQSERQEPARLASLAAMRLLNGPVAGAPPTGSIPDVKSLKVAELSDFHRRYYTSKNSALIVVGGVESAKLRTLVEKHFAALHGEASEPPALPEAPKAPDTLRLVLVDRPGAVQSAIFAVQRFPKRSEPGYETRELLGRVVGGLFTSRINMNLREAHAYTYGAFGQPMANRNWGAFYVSTSVRSDATAPALVELIKELDKAKDAKLGAPIQAEEVARAKADAIHSVGAALEHTSRMAGRVADLYVDRLAPDYYTTYPKVLESIDVKTIAEAAQAFTPHRLIVVIVGDRSEIEKDLAAKGYKVELADPKLTE